MSFLFVRRKAREEEAPSGRELSAKQTEGELRNIKQLQTLRYAILLPSFCDALASQKSTSLPEGGLVNSPINPNLNEYFIIKIISA